MPGRGGGRYRRPARRSTFPGKHLGHAAQACPRIGWRLVGRVFDPGLTDFGQERSQAIPTGGKQGPQETDGAGFPQSGHAAQAIHATAMGEAEQHGFRLIFPMMRQGQMKNALRMAAFGQEAITRIPCTRLDARSGLGSLPAQNVVLDAPLLEPEANLNRLHCGIMPQAMIDRQSQEEPPRLSVQAFRSRQSARLSAPPETPTATRGPARTARAGPSGG